MRGITLFSKSTGVEVKGNDIIKKDKKFGAITLRFFKLDNGETQMRFIIAPVESFEIGLMVAQVIASTNAFKTSKTHKFEREGQEVSTTLSLEKWFKDDKTGYAISIKRDSESINVPMTGATFTYLGEFLKYLSTQQAWVNPVENTEKEEVSTKEVPTDLDIFDDDFDGEPATTEHVPDTPAPAADDYNSEPAPELAPVADGNIRASGVLEAVRNDKKGFKLGGEWITVNEHTKVTGVLKKGVFVTVEYRNGNGGGKFANVVEVAFA